MPKQSKTQLIDDEQKILELLEADAQASIDVIAKNCGFSRQKVWRIIKRLEEEKRIWGYTVIYEHEPSHLRHFTMLMKRTTIPLDQKVYQEMLTTRLDDLLPDSVIKMENIEYVHGSYDGVFTFFAPDLITAKKFCDRFCQRFNRFVAGVELLEGIFYVRNQTLRNPNLKKLISYL
ncbi:MAG: Lrp/AsnC family transcriptional regulator [Candidatus Thermoplasmatota archaeon]